MATVLAPTRFDPPDAPGGRIPLSAPELSGREREYLTACVDSGWVSSAGPFVERFERAVADYTGAAHAVAVASGTAGLHIALQLVGVQAGEEVVAPDVTFVAPINAIRYCGASPVLADVDPSTWQIDSGKLARFFQRRCVTREGGCYNRTTGRRVRAILPVHILGLACDMEAIMAVAREHDVAVVEDAAEGMGVFYRDRHVGTFGDVGVFSFNGNKIVTAGGGGMIVTADARLAERARYLTTQAKDDAVESYHREVGYNYRLTSVQAALGLAQLEQLEAFVERKRAIADRYRDAWRDLPGIVPMPVPPHTRATSWLYTILLPELTTLAERKAIVAELAQRGIEARPLWHPIHDLPPYRDCETVEIEHAPALVRRSISLPSSVGLSAADQERCIRALTEILAASVVP